MFISILEANDMELEDHSKTIPINQPIVDGKLNKIRDVSHYLNGENVP